MIIISCIKAPETQIKYIQIMFGNMPISYFNAAVLSLASLCALTEAAFSYTDLKYVVAFGDSYSFVQGSAGLANKTFIGSYVDYAYTASQLLNNKIIQNFTSTAEGGPNWLEQLTACAVKDGSYTPSDCPIALWDFAFAGASVSKEFLPPHNKYTIPLVNQTSRFLTYGEPALRSAGKLDKTKTLVTIWIGVNDIFDSKTYKPANITYEAFWAKELDAVFQQSVKPLYDNGFKNFLFMNLPPLDRTSANQRSKSPYPTKAQVNSWDGLLANRTKTWEATHTDSRAMLYDANKYLNKVMDNPSNYGITITNSYCAAWDQLGALTNASAYGCSPLNQYFWYNPVHL